MSMVSLFIMSTTVVTNDDSNSLGVCIGSLVKPWKCGASPCAFTGRMAPRVAEVGSVSTNVRSGKAVAQKPHETVVRARFRRKSI